MSDAPPSPGPDPGPAPDPGEATICLQLLREGDLSQREKLLGIVYTELRRLAAHYLQRERSDHTLQPTALVHEAYLKLVDQRNLDWKDRQHFFATAAQGMRRYLIDHARARRREKRGGGWQRVELDQDVAETEATSVDLLALDEALEKLKGYNERLAKLVELRFFAGLPMETVAELLEISERTAGREWAFARAWLQEQMSQE